jgi:uncharacterized membrane protein YeiH
LKEAAGEEERMRTKGWIFVLTLLAEAAGGIVIGILAAEKAWLLADWSYAIVSFVGFGLTFLASAVARSQWLYEKEFGL